MLSSLVLSHISIFRACPATLSTCLLLTTALPGEPQNPAAFERAAKAVGFTGIGHYPKSGFMHIDTGPARRWNDSSDFPGVAETKALPTPTFQTEPKRETIVDIVTKPEVLTGAGGVLTGAGAISQGSGPVQFALGVALVIVGGALQTRKRRRAWTEPSRHLHRHSKRAGLMNAKCSRCDWPNRLPPQCPELC